MAFFVDIDPPSLDCLQNQAGLTRQECDELLAQVTDILATCTEAFRDERRCPSPAGGPSPFFELTHYFLADAGLLLFRFVVSEAAAPYGVLQVVYADYKAIPRP